jgi:hypothetical protein
MVDLREMGINIMSMSLPPHPIRLQISELSKHMKGSNVGQPRKYTKYPLYK